MKPKLTLICMRYPCNACIIVQGLIIEVIEKVRRQRDVEFEKIVLNMPSDMFIVEGLEVEKPPAILINGEQVSAGNLVSTKQLLAMLDTY